ncbi:hypothetical protein WJX81_007263 [Elliptochloris bilobata]|uniref:Uncharacterized protein n=1 Tax=Elliptochloris bilobata TaxID=381761 RepID=A0AAW1RFY0_9CHLO
MQVPIKIIAVAKNSSGPAEACAGEWAAKLARYTAVQQKRVQPNPKRSDAPAVAVRTEGEAVLRALAGGDRVVVLDERGAELTSEGVAQLIAKAGDSGAAGLAFCIGGPHGHSEAVRERADVTVRLSACVLNHEVARIVLLEQLYRGWTILRGEPYHH